ncbi:MAG: ribosome silencing factor [Endomicrobia bacterium]|nr:ribosome silencing factor [Endomicrobiia bacterium]MDW8055674.1 ribosome silencing factor [Elusimicrobiota bacterium]
MAKLAINKKAQDVIILDLKKVSSFCDYFVIMSAQAETHTEALLQHILANIKTKFKILPHHTEGIEYKRWVIIDYISVVVHIMLPEVRDFYALEKVWSKGKRVSYERKSVKGSK